MGEEEFADVFRRIRNAIEEFSRELLARELDSLSALDVHTQDANG